MMTEKLLNIIQKIYTVIKNLSSTIYQFVIRHWKIVLFLVAVVIIAIIFFSYSASDMGLSQETIDEARADIENKEDINNKELTELEGELLLIDEELAGFDKNALESKDNEINARLDIVIDKYKYLVSE